MSRPVTYFHSATISKPSTIISPQSRIVQTGDKENCVFFDSLDESASSLGIRQHQDGDIFSIFSRRRESTFPPFFFTIPSPVHTGVHRTQYSSSPDSTSARGKREKKQDEKRGRWRWMVKGYDQKTDKDGERSEKETKRRMRGKRARKRKSN